MSKFFAHSSARDTKSAHERSTTRGHVAATNAQNKAGNTTITSSGTVIRGNQDLANSEGYRNAIAEIRRIRGTTGK